MNKLLLFFILIISPASLFAQESLTLGAAIETALKNNYQVNVSRNDETIAKNNNTAGNAGMLPRADIFAGYSKSLNNTKQNYSDGRVVNRDNASVESISAEAQLTWTLFDGTRMFVTHSRLGVQEEAASMALKLQLENTVADVTLAYFNIVKIRQQIRVLEEIITIYDERIKIADTRFTIGSASKLDLLQAQVDRNEQASEILRQKVNLDDAMSELNRLMGRNDFSTFSVADSITVDYVPSNNFLQTVFDNNREIKLSELNTQTERYFEKEIRSLRYPTLDLNLNYNYTRTDNEVGLILLNRIQGPSAGLTFSWNIFNGFNTEREIKNARLNYRTAELLLEDTRSKIRHDVYVALKKFQSDAEILKLEETNWNFARENTTVALEAYRLGSISGLQLKEAQNSYEDAFARLVEARYQAKVSEITLMRLNGDLVK